MGVDLEARLRKFYACAPQTVRRIQTLEISHSSMSKAFNLWREPYAGTTQAGGATKNMLACNVETKLAGSAGNLDQKYDITVGTVDADDIFMGELDRIPLNTKEKIRVIYREFLSDDLTAPLASHRLQAESVAYVLGAASISAVSPRLNMLRTGELYTPKEIPMLRGFT
jgi:hypothetical protein